MFVIFSKSIVPNSLKNSQFKATEILRSYSKSKSSYVKKKVLVDPKCRVLFITGGTDGIGFAIANEFLFRKARGVILAGLNLPKGQESVNCFNSAYGKSKAIFVKTDITQPGSLIDAYAAGLKEYNNIDIVVNSAGVILGSSYEHEFKVNVIGTTHSTIEACKLFKKQASPGTIINICGVQGLDSFPGAPTLSACHHAIVGLSNSLGHKSLAKKLNVRIITLCVGFSNTNFYQDAPSKTLQLDKKIAEILAKDLKECKKQSPDACGKAAIELVKYARSGTVWVVEGSKMYSINYPHWKSCSTLVNQFI